jgi:neutral ceramidase
VQVGFGEEVITPPNPVGHVLAGYITRRGVSKGVHDDIYVRVLFIEAERPLAIASLDLLAVDERIVEDLRRISQGALGAALTVVAATHTHSAPATLFSNPLLTYGSETFREDYYQFILDQIMPSLLPLAFTLFAYWLIKYKNVSYGKAAIILFLTALLLGVLGILG